MLPATAGHIVTYAGMMADMTDDDVVSYQAAVRGTPVLSKSGTRIGKLAHVLQAPELDLFDGLVVHTHHGLRFVDADQVERITRTSIHTSLTEAQGASLPKPDGPPVYEIDALAVIDQERNASLLRLFNRPYGHIPPRDNFVPPAG